MPRRSSAAAAESATTSPAALARALLDAMPTEDAVNLLSTTQEMVKDLLPSNAPARVMNVEEALKNMLAPPSPPSSPPDVTSSPARVLPNAPASADIIRDKPSLDMETPTWEDEGAGVTPEQTPRVSFGPAAATTPSGVNLASIDKTPRPPLLSDMRMRSDTNVNLEAAMEARKSRASFGRSPAVAADDESSTSSEGEGGSNPSCSRPSSASRQSTTTLGFYGASPGEPPGAGAMASAMMKAEKMRASEAKREAKEAKRKKKEALEKARQEELERVKVSRRPRL